MVDEFGHASLAEPMEVGEVYASVEQMSAVKTMATFQQIDAVGLDIELRKGRDGRKEYGHQKDKFFHNYGFL